MIKQKILIVGGSGYIGGYLTDVLNKLYDITVYDNLTYESRFLKKINFIYGDVRDYKKLKSIINDYDAIIWLAAIVGDGACAINPELSQEINFNSVKWLVDNYSGKIIFTSTCSVYGMNNDLIGEDAVPNPLSIYASTKLESEQYILNNKKDSLIFRLGTLFGMGDEYSRIRLDLVSNILTYKATIGESLSVFGGEQWRPLLHVKDVTTGIKFGLENNISGLFNLSYKNFTIKDIANIILTIIPNTKINYVTLKFEDLRNYKVKNDKFVSLGWVPEFTLEQGIKEIYNVISQNRITNPTDVVYSNADYLSKIWKQN